MKQSRAIQVFHWLEELKSLQIKRQDFGLSQREQYRLDELRTRLKSQLAERQNRKREFSASSRFARNLSDTSATAKETGDQRAFVQQAIVTKHDSFSSLPFVTVRHQTDHETYSQKDETSELDSFSNADSVPHTVPSAPRPQATSQDDNPDATGDFEAFDLFHPPESLK